MQYITLVPAYGRDYKNKKEVQADWDAGKDFQVPGGPYTNKDDAPKGATLNIRFKRMANIHVIQN